MVIAILSVHALVRAYPDASTLTVPASLTAFETRWLAELVRRHEERHGPLEDRSALVAARTEVPEFEARVLRRAAELGAREGWRDAIVRWHGRARLALGVAAVLALVLGFGAAAGVLGDGSRAVNVVWALGGLLGVNLLSLMLWVLATVLQGGRPRAGLQAGGALGSWWLRLVAVFDRSPAAADLPLALGSLLGRGRAASWGLGAVSHGLWALALLGAAAGVLTLLATRRYGFVWETTILPSGVFVSLTDVLGSLPAVLGFPVPDAATVAASGDAPMLEEGGRRAWAGWLLGALLVYGVLPRAVLTALCAGLWVRKARALRLDLGRAAYARLRPLLLPDSERIGVRDPDSAVIPRPTRHAALAVGAGAPALVALELGADLRWPPSAPTAASAQAAEAWRRFAACDAGRLDSGEQRRAALKGFVTTPPRRLLIAVDPRRTPDRGNLGLIAELADHAVETRIWALGVDVVDEISADRVSADKVRGNSRSAAPIDAGRLPQWREGLVRLGFAPEALMVDAGLARDWLLGRTLEQTP